MAKKKKLPSSVRFYGGVLAAFAAVGFLIGRKEGKKRILILGDSQSQTHSTRLQPTPRTAAYTLGPSIAKYLRGKGHDATAVGVAGRGVRSYLSAKPGKMALSEIFAEHKPEVLIVELGGNDAIFLSPRGGNMSESFYKRKLAEFVGKAKEAGVKKIIWLGPSYVDDPSYNALRLNIAKWQSEVLPGLGVRWSSQQEVTKPLRRGDGLHHDSSGYAVWSAKVAPTLERQV